MFNTKTKKSITQYSLKRVNSCSDIIDTQENFKKAKNILHEIKKRPKQEKINSFIYGQESIDSRNIFSLSPEEAANIRSVLSEIKYDPIGGEGYISRLRKSVIEAFPPRILKVLNEQKKSIDIKPYIILKGLPYDNVTGSPKDGETGEQYKKTNLSENINIAVALLLGEPYSIEFEGKHIVNNLVPDKSHSGKYTGLGYDTELDFHIENAALKHTHNYVSPMGLILQGVRHDSNAPLTKISDAYKALERLSEEEKEELSKPNFTIKVPYRWRTKYPEQVENVSVLSLDKTPDLSAVFYFGMIQANTHEADYALKKLENLINETSIGLDINPSMLIYVDNRRCMHARTKFDATFDDNGCANRWLQRTFVAPSLWEFRDIPQTHDGGRVFKP